jgi:hypothetical protein
MPYDAAWGNTWSDASGVLSSRVLALAEFYDCTVPTDDVMYRSQAECTAVCKAGSCVLQGAKGVLSAPEHVVLNPNSSYAREVVFTTLSPVLLVSDTVRMVIKAVHPNITVAVQEDPGLPIGMTSALNADRSELSVAWTPRAGQEGAMHELFVVATRNGVKSKDFAVRIGVAAGALAWDKPTQLETTHQIMVGQTKSAELVCVSNYPTDIKVAPNTTMPEHMSLTMTRAPRTLLGSGELAPFAPLSGTVTYAAHHGSQGKIVSACFVCHAALVAVSSQRCVGFHIEPCKYVTKPSDSLASLTRMFHASNNWRRLLNLNPSLSPDPNALMGDGQIVTVGSLYTIVPGDSLFGLAGRLSTTVKGILELNPALGSDAVVLQVGERLCVAACTLQPNPTYDMKEGA